MRGEKMVILKLVLYFIFCGVLGLAFSNFELKKPKNKFHTSREDMRWLDWMSIFIISGTFGIALPLALDKFLFKGEIGEGTFFVFAALGSFLREKIFPIIFHAMGRVANEAAKYYNKAIDEKMDEDISEDKQGNNNRDDNRQE